MLPPFSEFIEAACSSKILLSTYMVSLSRVMQAKVILYDGKNKDKYEYDHFNIFLFIFVTQHG